MDERGADKAGRKPQHRADKRMDEVIFLLVVCAVHMLRPRQTDMLYIRE